MQDQRIFDGTPNMLPRIVRDEHARALEEQFDAACELAARLYVEGSDTTEVDAEVDRLLHELRAAGLA